MLSAVPETLADEKSQEAILDQRGIKVKPLVGKVGIEPTTALADDILSVARIPIPPLALMFSFIQAAMCRL